MPFGQPGAAYEWRGSSRVAWCPFRPVSENLEGQVGDLACAVAARLAQLDRRGPGHVEKWDAVAQQHRYEVDEDLVYESGADAPRRDVSAEYPDVLGACCVLGRGDGLLGAARQNVTSPTVSPGR